MTYEESVNTMICKMCAKSFNRFVNLLIHIKNSHEKHKVFECGKCGKGFVLEWRLGRHINLHTQTNAQPRHYFNNNVNCPFDDFVCKFLHIASKNCKFGEKCKRMLCPYRHSEIALLTRKLMIMTIVRK